MGNKRMIEGKIRLNDQGILEQFDGANKRVCSSE